MLRRPRRIKRFVPRLEALEHRSMLSAGPLSQAALDAGLPAEVAVSGDARALVKSLGNSGSGTEAVGASGGQLEVLGVVTGRRVHQPVEVEIYNYTAPTAGASVGPFTATQTLQTDIPAGPNVKIAFGNLNRDGLPDLVVAGPDGHGSVAVDLFTSTQVSGTTNWTFKPLETDHIDLLSWSFGVSNASVALGDLNGDGAPDVVLTTGGQVGVLLGTPEQNATGTTIGADNYQALKPVQDPFLPYLPGGQAAIQDSKNIADGAAKGQAQERIMQNDQKGYDLVGEADNQFLFAQMEASTSTGITFPPVPGTQDTTGQTSVQSLAINPGSTSTLQPLTSPLTGVAQPASQIFATSIICITYPCPGDWTPPGLVAVIGKNVYLGTAVYNNATGQFTGAFDWIKASFDHNYSRKNGALLMADLDSGTDGTDAELFSVVLQPGPAVGSPPAAAVDFFLEIDGIDGE